MRSPSGQLSNLETMAVQDGEDDRSEDASLSNTQRSVDSLKLFSDEYSHVLVICIIYAYQIQRLDKIDQHWVLSALGQGIRS